MQFRFWPFRKTTKENAHIRAFIQSAFKISPKNISVYEQALRHSSAATKIRPGLKNSNERLEFLGDAVLDSIVAHYLYNKYPMLPEGELTKMKSKVVRRGHLNEIGATLGLAELLQLNLGKQEMHDSIMGNAFEALIGAIYLDQGYPATQTIILHILKKYGLDTRVHDDVDYKSKLHEWSQKYKRSLEFKVVEHRNEGGTSYYKIELLVDDRSYGVGEGSSKKSAEQRAAKMAADRIFNH
jgi:ribonuclease-3